MLRSVEVTNIRKPSTETYGDRRTKRKEEKEKGKKESEGERERKGVSAVVR